MGNENPWFNAALLIIAILMIAIAAFIPVKLVQLFMREWLNRRRP